MPLQVITIARKKYATGLFWQPVPPDGNRTRFIEDIKKFVPGRTKFVVEYHGMIGIGSRALGHSANLPSAAAEVMDAFDELNGFLAAFVVPEGFWIIAVRQGIILLDQLYSDAAAARAEYGKYLTLPEWGIIIAPGDWSVSSAVEKTLPDIIRGGAKHKIKKIGFWQKYALIGLGAVALIALLWFLREPIAGLFVPKPAAPKPNPELVAQYKDEGRKIKDEITTVVTEPEITGYPSLVARAQQCWRAVSFVMQQVTGWKHISATCDADVVSAELMRDFGAVSDLEFVTAGIMPGAVITGGGENSATITAKLSKLPTAAAVPKYMAAEIAHDIGSVFQIMNMRANIIVNADNSVTVVAESKMTPGEFAKIFDGFEPAAMPSVRWDNAGRAWNYEIIIYGK
ncbi:MAG: type 4b pilus protein PilO2 [Rickettsiales bacterium]|jgi:hypothetical protein|nr:type 4b pilus protein PilO2 [Rickettsiales bacterium]